MATAICDGAARNSALATTTRLMNSHSASPPATDSRPPDSAPAARQRGGARHPPQRAALLPGSWSSSRRWSRSWLPPLPLIGHLRYAWKQYPIGLEAGGQVAEVV